MQNPVFINSAIKHLPIDEINVNYPRIVKACFSFVNPSPIINPKLVCVSEEVLDMIGLKNDSILEYFSGNDLIPGSQPVSHCYCGHQFGIFAGQLGDGRAILLGEIEHMGKKNEIQLKGCGKTPFSRKGDGRAVLRSSIREFLCSEAMHHLGIPTTRAASIITSDSFVERDLNYDGNIKYERATVVSRVAPTFIRFGSFQIADNEGPSFGNPGIVLKLTLYVIENFYPEIHKKYDNVEKRVLVFAEEIMKRTAKLVAHWQSVGFVHGVLNTDNMSIIGLTMDYGPFSFMDNFDPSFVSNTTDNKARYQFGNQPFICKWNLNKLFLSISNVFPKIKKNLETILDEYCKMYQNFYLNKMSKKLGLLSKKSDDIDLINSLLDTMYATTADYNNVFRHLSSIKIHDTLEKQTIIQKLIDESDVKNMFSNELWIIWINKYISRVRLDFENNVELLKKRKIMMNMNNPKFILRNYLLQDAINMAENGDYTEVKKLLNIISDPYDLDDKYNNTKYDKKTPISYQNSLSCSS